MSVSLHASSLFLYLVRFRSTGVRFSVSYTPTDFSTCGLMSSRLPANKALDERIGMSMP
jgi:hypothetical protein